VDLEVPANEIEDDDEQAQLTGAPEAELQTPSFTVLAAAGARRAIRRCPRRTMRCLAACRRQHFVGLAEKQLRSFTRQMLQRPLLLWLFYIHVAVIWTVEIYRQAVNRSISSDPATQLEKVVAARRAP